MASAVFCRPGPRWAQDGEDMIFEASGQGRGLLPIVGGPRASVQTP
jgi:hypothetical protein